MPMQKEELLSQKAAKADLAGESALRICSALPAEGNESRIACIGFPLSAMMWGFDSGYTSLRILCRARAVSMARALSPGAEALEFRVAGDRGPTRTWHESPEGWIIPLARRRAVMTPISDGDARPKDSAPPGMGMLCGDSR